ncbi:LolA family protein [Streptomyces sp. URMC 125]|uniref:LolA family protein n=1 Tax=Streptomyces sp. URMC 125 TaxID=3423419 RepID=UPI003F1DEA6E
MAQNRPMKKALRYAVPAAVAGAAIATVGLVPALASSDGTPDLPGITAEQLVAKIASSETEQLSGTVKITTDLGLPALPGTGRGGGREGAGEGADPQAKLMELASGTHTLRVAVDGPDRQRVSVVEEAAEYTLVRNGKDVWAYDSAANAVHHTVLPEGAGDAAPEEASRGLEKATPQKAAQEVLAAVDGTTSVTVDGTAKVAGQDAYQLLVRPKQPESTVGSVRIAVDADSGVPLKFTLTPRDGGKAVIDVGFTEVDFAKPPADTFEFTPPQGAEVTEERPEKPGDGPREEPRGGHEGHGLPSGLEVVGSGWGSVAELRMPGGRADAPGGTDGAKGPDGARAAEAQRFLDGLTDEVGGDFGTGRVFSTRLVNALITDDGTVYVGAVTKEGLVKAAEAAEKADRDGTRPGSAG